MYKNLLFNTVIVICLICFIVSFILVYQSPVTGLVSFFSIIIAAVTISEKLDYNKKRKEMKLQEVDTDRPE